MGSPQCVYCEEQEEDVSHTFYACGHFAKDRRTLASTVGGIDTIVEVMFSREDVWRQLPHMTTWYIARSEKMDAWVTPRFPV